MLANKITNCSFTFRCHKNWESLTRTENQSIRYCDDCDRGVYLADDLESLGFLASAGKCVAIFEPQTEIETDVTDEGSDFFLGMVEYDARSDGDEIERWLQEIDCPHDELRGKAPGVLLNDSSPGTDGNYYSIDRSEGGGDKFDLWKSVPRHFFAPGFDVYEIGVAITVEKLYKRIESVGIYIQGHEAIVLGLPFHGDNF